MRLPRERRQVLYALNDARPPLLAWPAPEQQRRATLVLGGFSVV